ncbi:MAG TPA: hypothetical protein VGC13_10635 [Longimicrobium sp.]|uniref:hypothetical protein n=1 Tax=Longimicrobium sp. TaxID=2029185 RepID=UPI002EDB3B5F
MEQTDPARRPRRQRTRGSSRLWCIPPVMLRDPGEGLERAAVLDESAGELGVLLWRTVRDVELWAATPAARRRGLFHPDGAEHRVRRLVQTGVPAQLAEPLDALADLLSTPERVSPEALARGCLRVAEWAGGTGAPRTALAYAQAASLVLPDDAHAALQTGVWALHAGQRARAEVWLRRVVGLGRRADAWEPYARALLALAQLRERAEDPEHALRDYRLAYRSGLRYGVRDVRRGAARALLRLAAGSGDVEAARGWAVAVQRAYRPGAPDAAPLLLELARFWIGAGREANAVPALRRLAPREQELGAADRLAAAAMRARAYTSVKRDPALARDAAEEAFTLLRDVDVAAPVQLSAAVDLAHATAAQGDAPGFGRAVRTALRLASLAEYARVREELASLARTRHLAVPLLEAAA